MKVPPSPLVQVNHPDSPLVARFTSEWASLVTNPTLFSASSASATARFFDELYCLKVLPGTISASIRSLSTKDLLGDYKRNIELVFRHAVRVMKEHNPADLRKTHVVETLIPLLGDVLGRTQISNLQIMVLLAGSLEQSDAVFTDLVLSIDIILQDPLHPPTLRQRTLQLALVLVSSRVQGTLNAYFLRRDLFSTLIRFMSSPPTTSVSLIPPTPITISTIAPLPPHRSLTIIEPTLLLGLLASFHRFTARNPYLVRIEDLVDEGPMALILAAVNQVVEDCRDTYVRTEEATKKGKGVWALVDGLGMTWGPSEKAKPKERVEVGVLMNAREGEVKNGRPPNGQQSKNVNGQEADGKDTNSAGSTQKKEDQPFKALPPEIMAALLPFYDLLNSNKAFATLVFHETEDGLPSPLPLNLISLSSFLFCHATVSKRSRTYSRLMLIILLVLVEEGVDGKLTQTKAKIPLCRFKIPALPPSDDVILPIAAILDSALIFLRHNFKRLDVESYTICLKLLRRVMQQLKTEQVRLEYDWISLWRSILSLSSFVVSKIDQLRSVATHAKVNDLISQIFIVLAYTSYWGDSFFPSHTNAVDLHYELLRSESTLDALSDLLGISSVFQSPSLPYSTLALAPPSPQPQNRRDTPTRAEFFSFAPPPPLNRHSSRRSISGNSFSGGSNSFEATECVSNIHSLISFFSAKVASLQLAKKEAKAAEGGVFWGGMTNLALLLGKVGLGEEEEEQPGAEEVRMVIERNLGEVELVENNAMMDSRLRRWSEDEHEEFFSRLVEFVAEDTLGLVPRA